MTLLIFRWLLAHAADAPAIINRSRAVIDADGLADTWEAVKHFGDFVLPLLADFPLDLFSAMDATAQAAALSVAEGEYTAAGLNLDALRGVLPLLLKWLPLLLELAKRA